MTSPLRIGLIGCGHIAGSHLGAWRKIQGVHLVGVQDLRRDLAEARATAFGVERVFGEPRALIDACDVVDICTPPASHGALALEVLRAGRYLVIEKPLVTSSKEWEELSRVASTARAEPVTVIHNLKFGLAVQQAKRWIEEGRIGRVLRVRREFLTDPSTDRMLSGERHWSHELPGGRWFETLPHELYLTRLLAGPLKLSHVTALRTPAAPSGVSADEVSVELTGSDCLASIQFSAHCRQNRRELVVQGTSGRISVDVLSDAAVLDRWPDRLSHRAMGRVFLGSAGALAQAVRDRVRYSRHRLWGSTPHSRILRAVVSHLRQGGPPPTPWEEIRYVVENCDLVGRAIDAAVERLDRSSDGP